MSTLDVVISSTRPGRIGPAVADWFAARAQEHGAFDVNLVDLTEVALPLLDEPGHPAQRRYTHRHSRNWSAVVEAADAFVIVTPEYNAGLPAPLKNALDFLYEEWAGKPVGFVGYGMASRGANAVRMTKQIVMALRMRPTSRTVTVALRERTDAAGALQPDAAMDSAAAAMLDELTHLLAAAHGDRRTATAPARAGDGR